MAHSGPARPGKEALDRITEGLVVEMRQIAQDLEGRAAADAPREPVEEHVERHGTAKPLRDSFHYRVLRRVGRIVAVVSNDAFYAAWQEERREWKHPHGGKAGFLGDNVKVMTPEFARRLARASKAAIEGG